jgi:hypothetical protein
VLVTAQAQSLTAPSVPVTFHLRSADIKADKRTVFLSGAANTP